MSAAPRGGKGDPPDGLSAAEAGMWQAFRSGSVYDLRTGDRKVDDPRGERPWGAERSVRAQVVAWLLLDGPPALPGRVASLKLLGVQVTDVLDLTGATIVPYVELKECRFERELLFSDARLTTMRLVGCALP